MRSTMEEKKPSPPVPVAPLLPAGAHPGAHAPEIKQPINPTLGGFPPPMLEDLKRYSNIEDHNCCGKGCYYCCGLSAGVITDPQCICIPWPIDQCIASTMRCKPQSNCCDEVVCCVPSKAPVQMTR